MKLYMTKAYLTVINKIASVKENLKNNEDGMETVQAIILIVVGLVIVGGLVSLARWLLPEIKNQISDTMDQSSINVK